MCVLDKMGEWWNGLHKGLKILPVYSGCGFESHLAHQEVSQPSGWLFLLAAKS